MQTDGRSERAHLQPSISGYNQHLNRFGLSKWQEQLLQTDLNEWAADKNPPAHTANTNISTLRIIMIICGHTANRKNSVTVPQSSTGMSKFSF